MSGSTRASVTEPVVAYAVGIFSTSVCAEDTATRDEIERVVNARYPTGVGPWRISEDKTFAKGEPHPSPCNTTPGRCHWLLEC